MSLNWREIDLILRELDLVNTHVQKIYQPDFQSLVFQIYSPSNRFYLLIHLGQGQTRLHAASEKPEKKVKLQRFAQFLRSRIAGGRITGAVQIQGQRIVKLTILRGGETTVLWIRLWGNAANIIAADATGTVLDAFYRRPNRGEVSGGTYNPEKEFAELSAPADNDRYTVRDYETGGAASMPFNAFIDGQYGSADEAEKCSTLRRKALEGIEEQRLRLRKQVRDLEKKRKEFEECGKFKEIGDLITSSLHIMPEGERWLTTENYYRDNEPVDIELDPSRTPAENAERYYQKYRKAKSGLAHVRTELAAAEEKLRELDEREKQLAESGDPAFIEKTIREYRVKKKQVPARPEEKMPGLRFKSGNFTILVGRNAKENDALLRRHVQGSDYWLHSRDYPGGYVFIKAIKGKSVPLDTLLDAGNLALYYSKGKKSGTGELYYTLVKYLRRAKHGKQGTVIPTQEKNLSITLDSARIQGLLNQQSEDIV
jgi:predicted ribosome quality control (RQC) complex YloA/Tae2 family protein